MDRQAVLKQGTFYTVTDGADMIVLEDHTRRGLTARERSPDERLGVMADKGVIHGADGTGHTVPIRWFFPKCDHDVRDVLIHAESMEKRYADLQELACPDG